MNYRSLVLLCVLGCAPGLDLGADVLTTADETSEKERALLTPAQLDELLAPIALYPDPLVAIILPAATFPADVVMAARYLNAGGNLDEVENQSWDDSVKSLARYPDVVKWMDENLAWTQQVGAAFLLQPAAVLTGTQRLRVAARAAGNLNDTPEQTVVVERETIRIVPAQPEVIYVPVYDPVCVYRPRVVDMYYPYPLVTFSTGYRTGCWLSYHCDWGYNTVVVIGRRNRIVVWQTYPRWSCPPRSVVYDHHDWCPAPNKVQAVRRDYEHRSRVVVAQPTANSYVQRDEPRNEGGSRGAGVSASPSGEVRPTRPTSNKVTSIGRPAAPSVASSTPSAGTVAQRPTRLPESNHFGQNSEPRPITGGPMQRPRPSAPAVNPGESTPAPAAGTVSVAPVSPSPFRGDRGPGNHRLPTGVNLSAPSVVTTPAPVSSSVTARPGASSGLGSFRRPQPGAPSVSGVEAVTAPASNRVSAPARETTPTVAAPRRERENRMSPASSPFDRPSVRPSVGATQSVPASRTRNSPAPAASVITAETEDPASRPRG